MVTDLGFTFEEDTPFSLLCYSHNSPPTNVVWEKDNEILSLDSSSSRYKMTQVVVDRATSAYVSTLTMDGVLENVVGKYTCTITNSIGTSNKFSSTVKRTLYYLILLVAASYCHILINK